MKKIYIINIPPIESNYSYFYFLSDNAACFSAHGLHYIITQHDRRIYRHITLQQALQHAAASPLNKKAAEQEVKAALLPFEEWAKTSDEDILLCLGISSLNIQDILCHTLRLSDSL